jgi:hypothetical protein
MLFDCVEEGSMDKDLLCNECCKNIMEEAQKHGFVCKGKEDIRGAGTFCAYAARDYKGKKEGIILWQAFPNKNRGGDCKKYLSEDYSNKIIALAISLGYVKEVDGRGKHHEKTGQ